MDIITTDNSFKGISTNTYLDIEKFCFYSSFSHMLSTLMPISDELMTTVGIFSIATGLAYLSMNLFHVIDYTREIKQIKYLYQEFITNYNKLNRIFNLNDPVEINAMFSYLVSEGYLSTGKKFNFSDQHSRDMKAIMGANVMTGSAVCRHISAMLTDILNDYNIEAASVGVLSGKCHPYIRSSEEPKYTREELLNLLHANVLDEKIIKAIATVLEELDVNSLDFEIKTEKEKNIFKKTFGNHAITYAYMDGKSYYLDPTNDTIYRPVAGVLTDFEYNVALKNGGSAKFNDRARYVNMKKRINQNHPTLDIESQKKFRTETLDTCKNNTDIFENFYKENEELYKETSNLVLSLKRNRSVLSKK